jgi:RNA polymerase sigma-70 factor (ECF subfamily)
MAIRDIDLDGQRSAERALIERFARTRDPDAFSALVTSTRPWLVSTCTRILGGDCYTAEDVAQECYVKAFGFLANGGSPIDFRAWLFAVARNACIDEIRKVHAVPVDEVPERAVTDEELGLDAPLETAWTSLEPRQRTLIFMREFLGMSYREIADHTETSLPAVETALFRARSSLRRQYRRAGGTISGLAWLGFGLRGLLRGHRSGVMSAPARWAGSIQDRVNAVLARLPGSNPGDLVVGAASLTAVAVLAGVVALSPGTAGGTVDVRSGRAATAASAAASSSQGHHVANGRSRSAGAPSSSSPAPTAADAAGQDTTGGLDPQIGSAALGSTAQVVQDATDAVQKTTNDANKTVSNTVDAVQKAADDVTKTVSNTADAVTSDDKTDTSLPGL